MLQGQAHPQIRRRESGAGPNPPRDFRYLYGIGTDLADLRPQSISISWMDVDFLHWNTP